MIAVHEHFRLDDGDESGFLAQRGIAGQGMRVGLDATPAGNAIAQGDHRAPFGETGTHLEILLQAITQPVQTFGDLLSGMTRQILCADVDLDAGNDARIGEDLDKGRAVFLPLADRLVVEDRATDASRRDPVWSRSIPDRRAAPPRSGECPAAANRLLQVELLSSIASRPLSPATSALAVSMSACAFI